MKHTPRTTPSDKDEVFLSIVETLPLALGDDEPFEPSTNLIEHLRKTGAWDDVDMADLIYRLGIDFGLSFSNEEVAEFFNPSTGGAPRTNEEWERDVASKLTFADLANFVRIRLKPISFEPVSVLGSPPCPAAGYFVGMSELVEQVQPNAKRFGPSTPITSVMPSRQLPTFWRRLSRAAGRTLPPLSFWLNRLANVLLIVSAACLAFGVLTDWAFLAAVWLLCLKGILFGRWLHRRANPLPRGIVTFGDLSRHLAGQRDIPSPKPFARDIDVWVRRKLLRWPAPESPSEGNND